MMRLVLLWSFLISTLALSAQNLEFSRVVNLKGEVMGGTIDTIGTVPAGKVWKVENIVTQSSLYWYYEPGTATVVLSSTQGTLFASSSSSSTFSGPVWLAAGEPIVLRNSTSSTARGYYFSILEFTVSP